MSNDNRELEYMATALAILLVVAGLVFATLIAIGGPPDIGPFISSFR